MNAYDTTTKKFAGQAAVGMTCWCSIRFAVPESLYDYYERKNEQVPGSFSLHCPVGHGMIPAGKSKSQREAEELRDALAAERQRTEQARADAVFHRNRERIAARQVAAKKGQLTRMRNRIGNGVCPCCNRYFANLHRHMTGQHPDWSPETEGSPSPAIVLPLEITGVPTDWKRLSLRRRAMGISIEKAAAAIRLKPSSLRAYESGSLHSVSAARRYVTYLNEELAKTLNVVPV